MHTPAIMIAASLWAVDALFRTQLTFSIPASAIIFIEHCIGFAILTPVFFIRLNEIKQITLAQWINLFLMSAVSSVLGTILFTLALSHQDFITPVLLLKLQPVIVIAMSSMFLGEKITGKFALLALLALIGSYLLSFGWTIPSLALEGKMLIYVLSVSAMLCWSAGTIFSKRALHHLHFTTAMTLRYLLAIPAAGIIMYLMNQTYAPQLITWAQWWRFGVIAGITGGVGALSLYYFGLQKTRAQISTLAELMYPLISIIIGTTALNPYGAPQQLKMAQIAGIVILIASITILTSSSLKKNTVE